MDVTTRIEQFQKMAEADPENELGHFSLGSAYLKVGRLEDAIASLSRALEINPEMSKVYQLLGEALGRAGKREEAVALLTRGVRTAHVQGDRIPRDGMVDQLRALGAPVPTLERVAERVSESGGAGGEVGFRCARCGNPQGQLPKPPFKGALGEKVFAASCSTCWREWIGMGTKVINELGLVLSTREGQQVYDQYMVEFLQIEPA